MNPDEIFQPELSHSNVATSLQELLKAKPITEHKIVVSEKPKSALTLYIYYVCNQKVGYAPIIFSGFHPSSRIHSRKRSNSKSLSKNMNKYQLYRTLPGPMNGIEIMTTKISLTTKMNGILTMLTTIQGVKREKGILGEVGIFRCFFRNRF